MVTDLQKQYPNIRRVIHLCKHESACLVGAGTSLKQQIKRITGQDVYVGEYEEIKTSDRVNSAGRASYIERNQWMIDESDFVIGYLDAAKNTNGSSGAFLACTYATKKVTKIYKI